MFVWYLGVNLNLYKLEKMFTNRIKLQAWDLDS